ncbi:MAG: Cold shock-like protein CspA [candidate division BRC1 bacterium ADurb.BinA364]|nr:MAG: Cold shock-like protein CspA [candidate division BRC1 bacterium ADurb.BinA364]
MLCARGWVLADDPIERVAVIADGETLGEASLGVPRRDVAHEHPEYGRSDCGFSFAVHAPGRAWAGRTLRIQAFAGGQAVFEAARRIEARPLVYEYEGEGAGARAGRPVVAIAAHIQILPAVQGNRVAVVQLAEWLRMAGYRVFLVNQVPRPLGLEPILPDLKQLFDRVYLVDYPEVRPAERRQPICEGDYYSQATADCLRGIHERHGLSAIVAVYIHMASCMADLPDSILKLAMTIDVHSRFHEDVASRGVAIESFRRFTPEQERDLLRFAHIVIAIQDHERRMLEALVPDRTIVTVGLAADSFGSPSPLGAREPIVLFSGSGNPLNVRGLRMFLADCWGEIRRRAPRARLRIAGGAGEAIRGDRADWAAAGVEILGVVEDLRPLFDEAALAINCAELGTGLKIKTIEALARGKALLSTPAGVEGVDPYDETPYAVARDAAEFAAKAAELLLSPQRRLALERSARRYREKYLSFGFVYRELAEAMRVASEPAGHTGTVAWFAPEKGFGFVRSDRDGELAMVHSSGIAIPRCALLEPGTRVEFARRETSLGLEACDVRRRGALNVAFWGINSSVMFSGGRYHAWLMAEAAADAGHLTTFITNRKPVFYNDFASPLFPHHGELDLLIRDIGGEGPLDFGGVDCDALVVVPHSAPDMGFYENALAFAAERGARIVLLNFESPNWFNALSPSKRDPRLWDGWKLISRHAALVLSSAAEGTAFAREFYSGAHPDCRFAHCWAPINTRAADAAGDWPPEKRILIMTRFAFSEHKGAALAPELICETMRGHTLAVVAGSEAPDREFARPLERACARHGVALEWLPTLSEEAKWREIKRSCLVLFPSFFEGFGLPPVEAQYAGRPCVAFDLPVLREINGDVPYYAPPGDVEAFRKRIAEALVQGARGASAFRGAGGAFSFENYVERVDEILHRAALEGPPCAYRGARPAAGDSRPPGRRERRLPAKAYFGRCAYSLKTRRLSGRGWVLGRELERVEVLLEGGGSAGFARLGMRRADVLRKYPRYKDANAGFEFSLELPEPPGPSRLATVRAVARTGEIFEMAKPIALEL